MVNAKCAPYAFQICFQNIEISCDLVDSVLLTEDLSLDGILRRMFTIRANQHFFVICFEYTRSMSGIHEISLLSSISSRRQRLLRRSSASSLWSLNVRHVIYTREFTAREILRNTLTLIETGEVRVRREVRRCVLSENEKLFFTSYERDEHYRAFEM